MRSRAISVTITIWTFFGQVYPVFYLEKRIEVHQVQRFDFNSNADLNTEKPRKFDLYECDRTDAEYAGNHENKCKSVESFDKKLQIYYVANFNGVIDLELLMGNTIEIGGTQYIDQMIHSVLTLGVDHRKYHQPNFKPACRNRVYTENKVARYISRFVDPADVKLLEMFISVNNIGYFKAHTANTLELFVSLAATLKRVIDASGYNPEKSVNVAIEPPLKESSPPRPKYNVNSLPRTQSNPFHRALYWARTQSRSFSKSVSNSFQEVPSWRRSRSQTPTRSRSPSRLRSRSLSALQPRSQSPPRRPTDPQLQLKLALVDAAVYLALKMFDPCFVLDFNEEEKLTAESICKIYCQFLSTVIEVCMDVYSKRCIDLRTGRCVDSMCVCEAGVGLATREVNMAHCNNAFRLRIYSEAS